MRWLYRKIWSWLTGSVYVELPPLERAPITLAALQEDPNLVTQMTTQEYHRALWAHLSKTWKA